MGEEKNKKMSQKPQNHPNASRNFGTSPLVDNPFELLDQAHHLLVQAAELLRKDRNPMASDIHRIVAMLLSITFMSSQQRRKSIKSSLSHPKQHTRLHHRERPLLASRAKVNSHPTITSIFPTDDVPNLTIAAQKMEDPGLESQKSLINLKISPSFDKDTDVDLPSLCNLEIISKKRSFFQKSEVTRSLKLNRSVSSASCDASEGNSKKKRKDSGTEKQLKVFLPEELSIIYTISIYCFRLSNSILIPFRDKRQKLTPAYLHLLLFSRTAAIREGKLINRYEVKSNNRNENLLMSCRRFIFFYCIIIVLVPTY